MRKMEKMLTANNLYIRNAIQTLTYQQMTLCHMKEENTFHIATTSSRK